VTAHSTSGETADPLAGIVFHKASTAGAGVDGVTLEVASKDNPDKTVTVGGILLDTGSVFRAYRNGGGPGVCHYGKCFCLSVVGEGLLRAAGIPTRSVTNFRIAVDNPTFDSPIGVSDNAILLRVGGKDGGAGLTWWNFAPYASMAVGKGEIEKRVSTFQSWNETAIKRHGESVWNFHVWNEV
jgi:transglutaminase-like putative cysteine protease